MAKKRFRLRRWYALGSLYTALGAAAPNAVAWDNPLAHHGPAARRTMSIHVVPGNWGTAEVRDIERVLDSVARVVQTFIPAPSDQPLAIRVVPRRGSPRVLYDRGPQDEYVVHLTARNDLWFQYAYQFSHELCHILSHFDHKDRAGDHVAMGNQWFEESLCEAVSLYTLEQMALAWSAAPPARAWTGYAPVFASYAAFLREQPHRRLPAPLDMARWYRDEAASLRADPYQREKNELVANALLPLFASQPNAWRALAYLNPDTDSAAKDFPAFLSDWLAACPTEDKEVVRQTIRLFGLPPPTGLVAAAPRGTED